MTTPRQRQFLHQGRPQLIESSRQLWAFVECATGGVYEQALALRSAQGVELQVWVLIGGGNARIAQEAGIVAAYQKRLTETVPRR